MIKSPKILASARDQNCTFRIPGVCNYDRSTTVFCHGPDRNRGKAQKTDDFWGAYGCSACHSAMDMRSVPEWHEIWLQAIHLTQKQLIASGLIFVPERASNPKAVSKVMQRSSKLYRITGS